MSDRQEESPPTLEQRARRRVGLKKGWYMHALVFVLVNGGLMLMAWASGGLGDGSGWGRHHGAFRVFPLWGWGLGLAIHGAVVLLKHNGEGMTERMVAREIDVLKRREGGGS